MASTPPPSTPPPALIQAVQHHLDQSGLTQLEGPPARLTETLSGFLHQLLQSNQQLNLTRDDALPGAILRHLIEPLAAWHQIAALVPAGPLLDVGPGGGAPGLPIAIANPDRAITLVEARERKAQYLTQTASLLKLSHVTVRHDRAEHFAHSPARACFAAAFARALAPAPVALEILLPLLQKGGLAVIFAGPSIDQQLDATARAAADCGGDPPQILPLTWPGNDRDTRLVTVRKTAPTPDHYPRNLRQIKKDPVRRTPAPEAK